MPRFKIAIDGPCASGKSTVARLLAARLGYKYVNTGAMYRAVGLALLREGIDPLDEEGAARLLPSLEIDLQGPVKNQRVYLNGEDVTEEVASPEVASAASAASSLLTVRKDLVAKQQEMSKDGGVVLEGRDIGTVVLKDAEFKFFLVASIDERAKRRLRDYQAMGMTKSVDDVVDDLTRRDERDMTREHSPLTKAEDAIEIDTTDMSIEEVVNALASVIEEGRRGDG